MKALKNFLKLWESMKESELFFIYDSIDILYYSLYKTSLNWGESYIVSSNWLNNKEATINPKINDDKYFEYDKYFETAALNHEQFKNNWQRISKIKPSINQYNWQEIEFPSHKKDWKKLELNNNSIALHILYLPCNIEKNRSCIKFKT